MPYAAGTGKGAGQSQLGHGKGAPGPLTGPAPGAPVSAPATYSPPLAPAPGECREQPFPSQNSNTIKQMHLQP